MKSSDKAVLKIIEQERFTEKDDKLLQKIFNDQELNEVEERRWKIYITIQSLRSNSYAKHRIVKIIQKGFSFKYKEQVYPYLNAAYRIFGNMSNTSKKAENEFITEQLMDIVAKLKTQKDYNNAAKWLVEVAKMKGVYDMNEEDPLIEPPNVSFINDSLDIEEIINSFVEDVDFEEVEDDNTEEKTDTPTSSKDKS